MPRKPPRFSMKKAGLLFLLIVSTFSLLARDNPAYLLQTVGVAEYQEATFRLEGQLFIEDKARDAGAIAFAYTSSGGKFSKPFLDKYSTDAFKPNVWNRISVSGKIEKADQISVGAMFSGKGKYYFDDFKLFIQKGNSEVEIPLLNSDFERDSISPWYVSNLEDKSKLTLTSNKFNSGRQSLLIDNSLMESETFGSNNKVGKYADVNGIRLYYEIYGSGEPLLLIHHNNGSIASFDKQIPELSKKYMVIAVDSRGQGNSSADNTKLTYELFADDVSKLLDYLHIKSTNILGWSDGGTITLLLAIKRPDKVKKIAAMAAVLYNDSTSILSEINVLIRKQIFEMEQKGVDSNDIDYRLKKLLLTEPNINPDSIKQISVPVLIMAGENDIVKQEHTKLIAEKIPKGTLKIFKNTGHEAPRDIPTEFNKTVLGFFDKKQ
jgi:pimeloyl-ACP methyl ester carboxylesterase